MGQISNIDQIWKGWKAYLSGDNSEETKRKAAICKECDSAVDGTYEKLMPDFSLKELQGKKCKECGCPLSTLLRQNEKKCDLDKW